MRLPTGRLECLSEAEVLAVTDCALRVLDEVGMVIESEPMCRHLAEHGAVWDGRPRLTFPRALMEGYINAQRREDPPDPTGGFSYEGGISGYPLRWLDPADLQVKLHTAHSVADLTRLADHCANITGIGSVGVPSDVPPPLRPLLMRLIAWRYAGQTLSNSYVVWDARLCPHILELVQAVADMEPEQGGMERWLRVSNYMISPLRYARAEAEQFEWFWTRGQPFHVGNLISVGGAAPVTLAGAVALNLAENLALSFLHHAFFAREGLHLSGRAAPLDMRTGNMPYGRPEEALTALALSQIDNYYSGGSGGSAGHGTAAKGLDVEAGLNKGFGAGLQMGLCGRLTWTFGLYSTDEVTDPRFVVIEDEFVGSLRRLARGFEVNDATLAFEAIKDVGPGGSFLGHPHTAEHFREELWQARLFNGQSWEGWLAAGGKSILETAREKVLDILAGYHPRGIRAETEAALLGLIDGAADTLGISDYERPPLPQ